MERQAQPSPPEASPGDVHQPDPDQPSADEESADVPDPAGQQSRRSFVIRTMSILAALAVAIIAIPTAAFVSAPGWLSTAPRRLLSHTVSPALRSDEWTSAGPIDRLRLGQPKHMIIERPIVDGWVKGIAPIGVYVVRESDSKAVVLDPHCTHLGCPVDYSSGSGSFLCPCHGGAFDPEGYPSGGPPSRRLDTYETRVEDGEVFFRQLLDSEA